MRRTRRPAAVPRTEWPWPVPDFLPAGHTAAGQGQPSCGTASPRGRRKLRSSEAETSDRRVAPHLPPAKKNSNAAS